MTGCCVAYALAAVAIPVSYVALIYAFDGGENRRNDPRSVKKRFLAVVCNNVIAVFGTWALLRINYEYPLAQMGLHLTGAASAALLPTAYGSLKEIFDLRGWIRSSKDILWIRHTIMAPITEELAFRACSATLVRHCFGWSAAVFVAPLFFSLSHFHHVFDDQKQGLSLQAAIAQRGFQAAYTYLFGIYATFLFLQTGHIIAPILSHSLCNNFGLPNLSELINLTLFDMEENLRKAKRCVTWILKQFDFERKELSAKPLKELRDVVRRNELLIPAFVDVLFEHLNRENSDLRLAILLLANYFFQRSHQFRLILVDHLQDFLLLTLETDPLHYPLPKPPAAANLLKKEALETVRCWIDKFSAGYLKLKNAEQFLGVSKNFDFQRSNAELLVERNRAESERFNRELKAIKMREKISQLFNESFADVQKCLIECRAALELIFPKFCAIDESGRDISLSGTRNNSMKRLHGLSEQEMIIVSIPTSGSSKLSTSEDNKDVLNSLRDSKVLMEVQLTRINKWLKKLAEVGDSSALTKRLIDMKRDLIEEISRCKELDVGAELVKNKKVLSLKINLPKEEGNSGESSDDDSDFEDVPEKEGLELDFQNDVDDDNLPKHILDRINNMEDSDKPGPSGMQDVQFSSGVKTADTDECPKLSFGLDLKYWGQDIEPAEIVRQHPDGHTFWSAPNTDREPTNESEPLYKSRVMTFVGKLPEIKRRCRARLPSGKLCPRMDREKVSRHAFHQLTFWPVGAGKMRDEEEFLRDVEGATGTRLTVPAGRKKINAKTIIKKRDKPECTKVRERLETKLFDKRTLRRVSATLQQIQKARAENNFSNQFNYALQRR
uniref:Uncharacterized protein n=1 Tax=Ditylenchus dipsaci TaxID=166011 RepID=A0A915E230_9BILA